MSSDKTAKGLKNAGTIGGDGSVAFDGGACNVLQLISGRNVITVNVANIKPGQVYALVYQQLTPATPSTLVVAGVTTIGLLPDPYVHDAEYTVYVFFAISATTWVLIATPPATQPPA